jgi:hypothetical protein
VIADAALRIIPCSIADAKEFVWQVHRHHRPPVSGYFACAVADADQVRGVAIVGRPIAQELQDGFTADVTRTATDGAKNACSMLYSACWRAARALGYLRLGTYTLASEPGTSLRAAGWRELYRVTGRSWNCESRPRVDRHPLQDKIRWGVSVSHGPEEAFR